MAIQTKHGEVPATEIIDVTMEGTNLAFPAIGTPAYSAGDSTTIAVRSPWLSEDVALDSTVLWRLESSHEFHFGIRFLTPEVLERQLPAELCRLFNRRKIDRAA